MARRDGGAPAWMVTFGDLMALLTTFFILLLSFAEIDAQRYKQIAGSMERAFGVQWVRRLTESPQGGEVIGDRPEEVIEQRRKPETEEAPAPPPKPRVPGVLERRMEAGLRPEIAQGLVELRRQNGELIISFRHEAAFRSGSERLIRHFRPIIDKIARLLADTEGRIVVAGHTDNIPIRTQRFRSNWDLSTARAVSVVHQLLEKGELEPERLVAQGYADTRPLAPNDTPERRARNRRVEVRIRDEEG